MAGQHGAVVFDGLGLAAFAIEQGGDPDTRARIVRIGGEHRLKRRHRLLIPIEPRQHGPQCQSCLQIIRIHIQRLGEMIGGPRGVVAGERIAQTETGLREVGIGRQGGGEFGGRLVPAAEPRNTVATP